MINSKFFKLIVSLNNEQFNQFEFFLKYFEQARPKCIELYYIVKKIYNKAKHNWDQVILDKESIHKKLFKKPYNKKSSSLRGLSSEFNKYLINYCTFIQFKKENTYTFLNYLNERGIHDLFGDNYNEVIKGNNNKVGLNQLWKNIKLKELYSEYEVNNELKRSIDIEELLLNFEDFSTVKKLKLYCVLLQKSITRNFTISKTNIDKIEQVLNNHKKEGTLIYDLYKNSIKLLYNNSINYKFFKKLINDNIGFIDKNDLTVLFSSLLCFCQKQILTKNKDIQYYWSEHLSNYFYMYENDLLSDGEYTPIMHIKNICVLSIKRMKEDGSLKFGKEDVVKIIEESRKKTAPQFRESSYHFNMGVFYIYQKQYDTAIQILEKKMNYANYFFTYEVKLNLLKCYYLIDSDEKFENTIASFRTALRRDKLLPLAEKESRKNSLSAFTKLKMIKGKILHEYGYKREHDIFKLEEYLKTNTLNKVGDWFFEQINELKTK